LLWRGSQDAKVKSLRHLPTVDPSYKLAGVDDFDGDGIAELLWHNSTGATGVWLLNGTGNLKGCFNLPAVDPS